MQESILTDERIKLALTTMRKLRIYTILILSGFGLVQTQNPSPSHLDAAAAVAGLGRARAVAQVQRAAQQAVRLAHRRHVLAESGERQQALDELALHLAHLRARMQRTSAETGSTGLWYTPAHPKSRVGMCIIG